MTAESVKDEGGDAAVFIQCVSEDQNVIHVNTDNTLHDEVMEDLIHHGLEGGRTVSETEVHYQRLEETMVCLECHLPFISFLDVDIVVAPADVQFGKIPCTLESVDQVVDEGEWVVVFLHDGVQCVVVLDEVEFSILLDEENQSSER